MQANGSSQLGAVFERTGFPLAVVWAACAIHVLWAVLFMIPGYNPERATPVAAVVNVTGTSFPLATWFLIVAAAAVWGLLQDDELLGIFALLPQQFLLGISAWGAGHAMWASEYADGVARDRGFIMADQAPSIVLWLAHTATILWLYARQRGKRA